MFYIFYTGPHISLWMNCEKMDNSVDSISNWIGKRGKFRPLKFSIVLTPKVTLLVVKGDFF